MLTKHKIDHVVARKQGVDSVDRQHKFSAKLLPQVLAGAQRHSTGLTWLNNDADSSPDDVAHASPAGELEARIQIYWSYAHLQTLPEGSRAELVESLAELIGAKTQTRKQHLAYLDQTAFDWTVSPEAAQQFKQLVASNSASLRALPLDTILLEHQMGEVEAWFVKDRCWQCWQPADGSKIMSLLDRGLDSQLLVQELRATYRQSRYLALREPNQAIHLCELAIDQLDPTRYLGTLSSSTLSSVNLANLMQPKYSRGLFYLLLAAVQLNQAQELRQVEDHFLIGRDEFLASGWFFYMALADLGRAMALRDLDDLAEARDACLRAQDCLQQESQSDPAILGLTQAVADETARIDGRRVVESLLSTGRTATLKVFNAGAGARISARRGNADLHFFGRKDYEADEPLRETFTFNLERLARQTGIDIGAATYILEIAPGMTTDSSLQSGDWILIAGEIDPARLHHQPVLVLEEATQSASIKTFFNESDDHIFLKAISPADPAFVVEAYRSAGSIESYYKKYNKSGAIEYRAAYEVCISGAVIGLIRQGQMRLMTPPNLAGTSPVTPIIWQIPIVDRISAGLGVIRQAKVRDQWYLPDQECAGATFGLIVEGDSMAADGIFSGDIALIRQQERVDQGEIAAVVIQTPEKTLEVIKAYHVFDRPGREHWFLRSSHCTARHLVVIPAGVDPRAIKRLYQNRMSNVVFFKEAELWIAGKYIKKINAVKAH